MTSMDMYPHKETKRPRYTDTRPDETTQGCSLQPADNVKDISRLILDIFLENALNKFEHVEDHLGSSGDVFISVISRFVSKGERVQACLPAFPFKSANKVYKVLGSLPDKAEELALERLNTICKRIQQIYPPGAEIVVISDGITYNGTFVIADLLCISDQETWMYGEALRKMVVEKGFDNIYFSRIKDLLDFPLPEKSSEIIYVANCTTFRCLLMNEYGKGDLNIDREIATNPDTKLTYLGYKRFLESDLQYIFPRGENRSAHSYKQDCKYLAKQMLTRGYAFAAAIKKAFPNHLRLSIHESMCGTKLSISLLNTKTGFTTPWHCSVAQLADGVWVSAPMGEFNQDNRLELVHIDGKPSYYQEKLQRDGLTISMTGASYLQSARPINMNQYVNGSSSNRSLLKSLSSEVSLSSSEDSLSGSTLTTQETQSVPEFESAQTWLCIPPDKTNDLTARPKDNNASFSTSYGRRLIPQIMDNLADTDPDRTVFSLASVLNGNIKLNHVSARQFTRAVDKTAWWLRDQVGTPSAVQPVVYIGPHDLRHILLTYACVKAGYAAMFLSPKNNIEGVMAVLEATSCNIWVNAIDASPVPFVKEVRQRRPMTSLQLPLLDELLDTEFTEPFPYNKTFEDAINDPFCFLHTSGSTGLPKPIPWSHGLIGTMDAVRLLPPVGENADLVPWTSGWDEGDKIYSSFPMSHGAGIIMDILMPALFNLHCVLGPVGVLPNLNLVERLAVDVKIDIWSMVPSLVDELGEAPEVLAKLEGSKFICASGGPVNPVSAGRVNEVVRVLNLTGTTEGLFIGNLWTPREDWFWFCFHPYSGFEFKEAEADTYEHWVHRNEHWALFQGIFHTFPDKNSINFKDLYMKHPTKPNLWAFKGRSDDLVVLSNGYKISPLETEIFVTTHPAVNGCLIFGTGKPQAGLLIELKDPSSKPVELIDSIWETIQTANSMSRHKNQLLKDFVTFTLPDRPFLRTDKGTVKRSASLALYADYIERFYSSRSDDLDESISLDLSSINAIEDSIRTILSHSLPEAQDALPEADLFALGLDSLGVFAAIKTIRGASSLGEKIAPRHVYANPTITSLAATVSFLIAEAQAAKDTISSGQVRDDHVSGMNTVITQHKARQSFRLNAFDYVNPNHGMGIMLYFSIQDEISFEQVFANLQNGLNRTFDMIPALSGKIMSCSEQEIGYTKGDLCVTIPPLSKAASARDRLVYKDLSDILPSFDKLRAAGFPPSAFKDDLVLRDDPFPTLPADIFSGQVNFVSGGCIVAVDLNHCCLDGLGVMVALKAWAENCRYLQGDHTANCSWYDPESFNHSLPEIIHEQEGWSRPLDEIDPGTWSFLPFFPAGDMRTRREISTDVATASTKGHTLPPAPKFKLHNVWPLSRAERCPKTTLFLIKPDKLEKMKQEVIADPEAKGVIKSISDIVQAFLWRADIRVRYRIAKEIRKQTFEPEEVSILELPTDGRPYFSSLLPSTYMGSLLILNRSTMPIEKLCSDETSIGRVAYVLRQSAARITPQVVHDAFSILQSLPDHSRFSTANMGIEHMHVMISNMMLFPSSEVCFGDTFFANRGLPESLRPQLERGNGRFRFLVIYPIREDGGIEFAMGTYPEELEMFQTDEEFSKYANIVDTRC
ncbi:transferase family protein [Talaromyces proteolyticus]|uniref:Transferase family protein n=1 Tax=Talaromyces proteolyticus TaxID=1131652 RepID=A0AAD4KWB4_9EURO|nr:transferase family protein [Talaromyces proteolyticus]KAH8702402.1 transferase family protein [Talaromyces proteolyticus]